MLVSQGESFYEAPECVSSHVEVDLVDLVDDLQVSGQERLQQIYGPALQSFGQDCVIGVGKGAPGEVPGLQTREKLRQEQLLNAPYFCSPI